jgi:hypothetical protein
LPFTRVVTVAVLQPAHSGTLPGGPPSAIRDIRLRRNRLLLSASEFCAYYHPVRAIRFATNGEICPSDGLAHSTSFDLGWRSSRFRDFPVFRPCVTPALATSTLTRVARFQTTHTRRVASLTPRLPTATVKATVDPRTSSQRIPSCNHTLTGPVQHRLQSLSKCVRSNAGQFRFVYPA